MDQGKQEEYFRFRKKRALFTAIAIVLFILAPLMFLVFEDSNVRILPFIAFFGFIAVGVAFMVYFGIMEARYREKLGIMDEPWKKDRKYEAVTAVLWLVTVIVYLVIGFLLNYWHPGWIVFLVAAVIQVIIDYSAKGKYENK